MIKKITLVAALCGAFFAASAHAEVSTASSDWHKTPSLNSSSAATVQPTSLAAMSQGPSKYEIYAKAGFLGAGLGFGYGVSENLTLRADFTTIGNYSLNRNVNGTDYSATLSNNMATIYADWFPFSSSGFRMTAGLGYRDMKVNGTGDGTGISGIPPGYATPADTIDAQIKWPKVAPYLGLGYGHNIGQNAQAGWGFVFDAGVYLGSPSVSATLSDSARTKLDLYAPGGAQAELDRQVASIQEQADKLKVMPSIYAGVSYRW